MFLFVAINPFANPCMSDLTGRYTRQLALFDVRGFTDPSRTPGSSVRLGPSGKPWIDVEEVDAAAESLRQMVAELQDEITELDSEYQRLMMSVDIPPDSSVAEGPDDVDAPAASGRTPA